MATVNELHASRTQAIEQAKALLAKPQITAEQVAEAKAMYADAARMGEQIALLTDLSEMAGHELEQAGRAAQQETKTRQGQNKFANFGDFLTSVYLAGRADHRRYLDPRLAQFHDMPVEEALKNLVPDAPGIPRVLPGMKTGQVGAGWESDVRSLQSKAMAESVGADGGFLVPTEFRPEVLAVDPSLQPIRTLATIIPMSRRAVQIPVLDQTSTTAGKPAWFGGLDAFWTEEATEKTEDSPRFRQLTLVAHELICYTRASDSLMADSAISLDAWLRSPMGFTGAIRWYEEYAFLRGTGAGQPFGVIAAVNTPTVVQPAAGATLAVADITGMLEHFFGRNPVWHISRSQMSELLQLNGPVGNPSYIFIPNGRDGMPATLMGYPIIWEDKLPAAGTQGSILLADWSYYVIGDRQDTTIESTQFDRWRYNQTSWRAVHRVDGQPWMSAPVTLSDGVSTVSPFVILGAATS